jgi:nucleotidyltransferase substrate binding protein (TIGR01987 family)
MDNDDIRWQQRFQNFEKSLEHLQEAMEIKDPDILQQAGLIHFFEMTFELSWNVLKDYLKEEGFDNIKSPRGTLKKAFEIDLIENGEHWLELLTDRNLTAHTYDEGKAKEVVKLIHEKYFPLLENLYLTFKQKAND